MQKGSKHTADTKVKLKKTEEQRLAHSARMRELWKERKLKQWDDMVANAGQSSAVKEEENEGTD